MESILYLLLLTVVEGSFVVISKVTCNSAQLLDVLGSTLGTTVVELFGVAAV
jgi:hypothetical protein